MATVGDRAASFLSQTVNADALFAEGDSDFKLFTANARQGKDSSPHAVLTPLSSPFDQLQRDGRRRQQHAATHAGLLAGANLEGAGDLEALDCALAAVVGIY